MMQSDSDRIRRLERALRLLSVGFALAVALAAFALHRATREPPPAPSEISLNGLTLSEWGLNVEHEVSPNRHSGAKLEATSAASYLTLGVGKLDVTIAVDAKSNILRFEALGKVESRIEVDTDTGAWTLVRTLHDAKYNVIKEDRLPLVGALQP